MDSENHKGHRSVDKKQKIPRPGVEPGTLG